VPLGHRELFVPLADIDWLEANDYYVNVHVGDCTHLLREPLVSLEARLDPARFARIHRSALVNVERVVEIERTSPLEAHAVLADGTRLRISRARRDELARRLLATRPALARRR
jgi:two-component system, LytTR family, response regulator